MKYVLGLDLGITSVVWAIYDVDHPTIKKCGVRLFDVAENVIDRNKTRGVRRSRRLALRSVPDMAHLNKYSIYQIISCQI